MKLATFTHASGAPRIGAVSADEKQIVDLQRLHELQCGKGSDAFTSMQALIEAGDAGLATAQDLIAKRAAEGTLSLAEVKLLAPLPRPASIRDGLAFEKHFRQAGRGMQKLMAKVLPPPPGSSPAPLFEVPELWHQQPFYYKGNRFSVIGPDADIEWPRYAEALDYELEFGIYIKGHARDVKAEDARKYIFGYTIFNDVSARDKLGSEMRGGFGPAKGKDFDTGNVMGPWIVTADEILDPYALEMVVRVNGEERGRGNSNSITWTFEKQIAYISQSETLHPGEFIGSGTVGDGAGLEHSRFLEPGDVIELEIEKLGVLRNRIVRPKN